MGDESARELSSVSCVRRTGIRVEKGSRSGITRSLSLTTNPSDNAVIESFFSTLHFDQAARDHRVERQFLQLAKEAHDDWEHQLNQVRIGLADASEEELLNLSTKVGQAHLVRSIRPFTDECHAYRFTRANGMPFRGELLGTRASSTELIPGKLWSGDTESDGAAVLFRSHP